MYAERLNKLCAMEVREAREGDEVKRGLALIAPADLQMRVVRSPLGGYRVTCTHGEKVSGHRPSVDVLFRSMAENVQCRMVGIIMTGMGADGAKGLLEMRKKGAFTIGLRNARRGPRHRGRHGSGILQGYCRRADPAFENE